MDNIGNYRYIQQITKFGDAYNVINSISKWKLNDDDNYERTIEVYKLGRTTKEEVISLFTTENIDLNKLFGDRIIIKKEIKNNVSQEELEQEDFLQAVFYLTYLDEYEYVECTESEQQTYKILFSIVFSGCNILIVSLILGSKLKIRFIEL